LAVAIDLLLLGSLCGFKTLTLLLVLGEKSLTLLLTLRFLGF
jgi:hypothetical protein